MTIPETLGYLFVIILVTGMLSIFMVFLVSALRALLNNND